LAKSKKAASPKDIHTLRIVGGIHRGRKLPIPALEGLRPTSDRTRETLFNWLQFDLPGMKVLDLFAGTGALGLEALSRDAELAVMIEPQQIAAQAIKESLHTLKLTNGSVHSMSSNQFMASTDVGFDLIFVDPPFSGDLWNETLSSLAENDILNNGGYAYLECPKNEVVNIPDVFTTVKDKTAGKVRFRLLQKT